MSHWISKFVAIIELRVLVSLAATNPVAVANVEFVKIGVACQKTQPTRETMRLVRTHETSVVDGTHVIPVAAIVVGNGQSQGGMEHTHARNPKRTPKALA